MNVLFSLMIGIGLSAACGFRIFVPLLIMSIGSISGLLELSSNFAWIGTYTALIVFLAATIIEITAYFVPWLDNILDTIATPIAILAGITVMASCLHELSPLLKWSLSVIAGGSISGVIQVSSTVIRGVSTGITGGLANFIVAGIEIIASIVISIIAIIFPIVAFIVVLIVLFIIACKKKKLMQKQRTQI
ncbi:DUF4126 domain-containing protein [Abyssisolibacter fermentans]|uniref:DUF4126 domain-containing protein n=1 Tax=Abyssisolibacter fermentans TaxID=1766203 RepID=UPI0008360F65|nr:DUF4126 domain-containing protein [Abyssisolibacter fermentans]